MPKFNILYVITKLELGGAQKQLLSIIRGMDPARFNIFLLTARQGLLIEDALCLKHASIKRSSFLERPLNPLKDLLAIIEIYLFIKKHHIHIVHTHSSKAGILGRWAAHLAGTKNIIHTVHGWPFHAFQPKAAFQLYRWLERITAKITKTIIVVSAYDRNTGLENKVGCIEKYRLIRCGIDYDEFSHSESEIVKQELGIDPGALVVGNISCFKPQKAPQDFIRLVLSLHKQFPEVRFLLVGDGVLREHVEEMIKDNGLKGKVILTGWRRDVGRLLSTMDVLVLNSLWEGLPVSVLEAMASGKPVVASDTGGVKEVVIEGKTGFIVPCRDIEAMSGKVKELLKNSALRKQMGCRAKDVGGFAMDKMIDNTEELYLELGCSHKQEELCIRT